MEPNPEVRCTTGREIAAMRDEVKNIVVIGGGYGGITATLRLASLFHSHPEYQIHLIDKNPFHTLKTQLHEAAVHKRVVTIDIGRIIRNRRIIFHLGVVTRIDPVGKTIFLEEKALPYDYVVVALGAEANFYGIPGLEQHAIPLQTIHDAEKIYELISKLCAKAASEGNPNRRRELLRFIVGGGGLSGVEFAAELVDHVNQCVRNYGISESEPEVILVEAGDKILPSLDDTLRERIQKKLRDKHVEVLTGTRIVEQTPDEVALSTNQRLRTRTLVWTGGIRIGDLATASRMKTGQSGRIVVDEYLCSRDYPGLYAIGDNALAANPQTGKPVPTAAQFALQQGRLAAGNIRADVFGKSRTPYQPRVWGEVISLGRHLAVGWLALPMPGKIRFFGFLGSLFKAAVTEKHVLLLRKESRNWIVKY